MSTLGLEALLSEVGTGASVRQGRPNAPCLAQPMSPMSFAIVGGLTGASACLPFELFDGTSADVIELARPIFVLDDADSIGVIGHIEQAETSVQRLTEAIKRTSGLTWAQIAEAMGFESPRAIHLWRSGGGISAAHEERLQELNTLVESIDLGSPADVRAELVEHTPAGSILDRLRAGESPMTPVLSAPWRSQMRAALARNIEAPADDQGVLDEDFLFLLELNDVSQFRTQAEAILDDPGMTRRDWKTLIDAQFAALTPPANPADFADDASSDDEPDVLEPLFRVADLGIELGVGAIASRRSLHEGA